MCGPVFISGNISLENGVIVDNKLKVVENAKVTVGQFTKIKFNCTFHGNIEIGSRCTINVGTVIFNAKIGNSVSIGWNCKINCGIILDGASILANAVVGRNVILGENSTLYSNNTIGDGSCVAANIHVNVDISPGHVMNVQGKSEPIGHGRKFFYRNGKCITTKSNVNE